MSLLLLQEVVAPADEHLEEQKEAGSLEEGEDPAAIAGYVP
jgi:hypothetical protein